jgi:TolB-like protein
LPVPEVVRILRDVVDALASAHSHGVVHRDIKPDNVMLAGRHALVMDFGVAKAISEATGRQSITTLGVALGTPAYMAPEQAAADPHVDHRADIYAVGFMGYELLAGQRPFTGSSPQQVLAAQITEAPRPVTLHRPTVPPALAQVVMRCLEKKPADRPQTAAELLPVLDLLSTTSGSTLSLPVPRRAPVLIKIALAVVGLLLLLAAGWWVSRRGDGGSTGSREEIRSIAVLPFQNQGGAAENQAFTDGIHDDILTQLSKIVAFQVTSRTSVEEYRTRSKGIKEIARELGVGAILEGGVQRSGNQVHVNVQLIDAARDRHIWAESYDRALTAENIFAIQGEIARQVASALQATLTADESDQLAEGPPTRNTWPSIFTTAAIS